MNSVPIPTASPLLSPAPLAPETEAGISFLPTVVKTVRELPRAVKFALIVLLPFLLVVVYFWTGRVSTDDAEVDAHITAVASQVSGYVVRLAIDDNVNVKREDVLLQIDPREYRAEADQAKASLDLAEAEANSAKLQIGLTRATTTHGTEGARSEERRVGKECVP